MGYLGRVITKSSNIVRQTISGSTSATHSLTVAPSSEQQLLITINGVKQHDGAYTVSGTTLTLSSALVATDELEIITFKDIGTTTIPSDGSVTTAKIADDAVTADKLANSINTEITANTAKVTNATHTGDVTGATALTIAADAVDIAMLSATGTASSSTFLRGDNSWAAAGGDNTPAFRACLSDNQTGTTSSGWTKVECDRETFDSDGAYDATTNYRFTVPVGAAGKYAVMGACGVGGSSGAAGAGQYANIRVNVNGGAWNTGSGAGRTQYSPAAGWDVYGLCHNVYPLAEGDYLELYVWHNLGASRRFEESVTFFAGWKLNGVT